VSAADLIPTGTYRAKLIGYEMGFSGTGSEQIGVLFRLPDEPHQGRELVWYGSFTEAAFPITHRALVAMGWRGTNVRTLKDDLSVDGGALVYLVVEVEEFGGKERNRIIFVNRMGGIPMRGKMSAPQRQAFAASVQLMIDAGVHTRKVAPTGGSPGATGADDDDIPF
jgi:hypothetical protein